MATIAQIVHDWLDEHPFLEETLSRGLVNNAALAEYLLPHIEKTLKKKIKFSAANMAIRRHTERIKTRPLLQQAFPPSDLSIRSDLIEITIYKHPEVQLHMQALYGIIDLKKGDFLTVTQGQHEVMIITNARHERAILKQFPARLIKKVIRSLSSISITLPEESTTMLGLFYLASRALNWDNVTIIDVVSTLTEMTFLVREEDTPRAYTALHQLTRGSCAVSSHARS
ncbi:MAG: hypothetical protein V1725_02215 [archaeon]